MMSLKPRILIVDDSLTVQMDIGEALQSAGFDTVLCADLRSAREALAHERAALVVLDILLPDGNGLDFLQELRSSPATAQIPVLLLSTEAEVNFLFPRVGAGAEEYIGKPYNLGQVVARARALTQADASGEVATGGETDPSLFSPKRLLAVDDSITYLQELASQLRQEGYAVILATSGEEALELLAAEPVDGILLDLIMPGLSGQDTCRRIKQRAEWRDIPLIMLTARDDREAMIEGFNAGADDYIAKSADFGVLKARLRAQLRRKHFEDENRRIREELVRSKTEATARKQVEQARQVSEARLSGLVNSVLDAIITVDSNHCITLFNPAAAIMFGLSAADALGSNIDRLIPSRFRPGHSDRIRRYAEAQVSARTMGNLREIFGRHADGSEFPIEASIAQLEVDGEKMFTVVLRDITERKRLDQELQEKNVELDSARSVAEKANLAKSDFLSSMSHELRTPLNAILGFTQLIESGTPLPTPAQRRSIEQILTAGWYLLELINEILDLALIESGKTTLSTEPVSLLEVMLECRTMVEPLAEKRGIGMIFPRFELPYFVSADRTRVKQVLINLLYNAIKYNKPEGSVAVEYTLSPPNSIRIGVCDTGKGLAPEQLAQLFQPFNRLGKEASAEEGTGIGLVVTKRLIELMGGTIGVDSTVGVGSVFWFELSLTTAPSLAVLEAEYATLMRPQVTDGTPVRTLLYVEDNPANLELVEQLIARRPDLRFLSAADGNLGVEFARVYQPEVIVMDINLPGISGLEVMQILRADPLTAHIPIIAISANALPHDIEKAIKAGFFKYITKPIKVIEFMAALDAALAYRERHQAQQPVKIN